MGSLKFWFEVICYFSGICNKNDHFNSQLGRLEREVDRKKFKECLLKEGNFFEAKTKCLLEQDIPLPSIIFGTTNWKSLIRIKEIEYLDDYCFGNKLNLPYSIGIKKDNSEDIEEFSNREDWENKINFYEGKNFKEKLRKAKKEFSFFFFNNPYFYGNFQVKFEVEEEIVESVFYPLLNFMEKYGFWGSKWNIGYERLEILQVNENNNDNSINDWRKTSFKLFDKASFSCKSFLSTFYIDMNSESFEFLKNFLNIYGFYFKTKKEFERKIKNIPKHFIFIKITNSGNKNGNYESIIKSLLKKKLNIRNCLRHICEEKKQNNKSEFKNECFDNNKKFQKDKEIECDVKNIYFQDGEFSLYFIEANLIDEFEGELQLISEFDFTQSTPMIKEARFFASVGSKLKENKEFNINQLKKGKIYNA